MLEVKNLTVQYGNLIIVDDVSFSASEGQWLMIVGPNGAGKSTILKAISQAVPHSGKVEFDNTNIAKYKSHERAKIIGVLAKAILSTILLLCRKLSAWGVMPTHGIFSRQVKRTNGTLQKRSKLQG